MIGRGCSVPLRGLKKKPQRYTNRVLERVKRFVGFAAARLEEETTEITDTVLERDHRVDSLKLIVFLTVQKSEEETTEMHS
jgi:hypothetical protein